MAGIFLPPFISVLLDTIPDHLSVYYMKWLFIQHIVNFCNFYVLDLTFLGAM